MLLYFVVRRLKFGEPSKMQAETSFQDSDAEFLQEFFWKILENCSEAVILFVLSCGLSILQYMKVEAKYG